MPIRVTCRKCKTRFTVSDKFAGRDGPCPKCKATIHIPAKTEEVVIHAPKDAGPKSSAGRSVAKPIFRIEAEVTALTWTVIVGIILTFFVLAFVMRMQFPDKSQFPWFITVVASIAVAIPATYGAYAILRDSELGAFTGRDLWARVLSCSAVYALLWLAMPLMEYAMHGYDAVGWGIALAAMAGLGAFAGSLAFGFEYLTGVLHYGMYLGCTLLLRWIVGIGALPGQFETPKAVHTAPEAAAHAVSAIVHSLVHVWQMFV